MQELKLVDIIVDVLVYGLVDEVARNVADKEVLRIGVKRLCGFRRATARPATRLPWKTVSLLYVALGLLY